MAFCNACGSDLDATAQFCAKCGAPAAPGAQAAAAPFAAAPAPRKSNLKPILIALAALAAVFVLGIASVTFFAFRAAKVLSHTRIEQNGDKVRIKSALGNVEANQLTPETAGRMGVEFYPGAKVLDSGAVTASIAGVSTLGADFESDDPPQKVYDFYKSRYPKAMVNEKDGDQYSIVATTDKGMTTIEIQPRDGKTHINLAVVGGGKDANSDTK
jgi:zinc-ribbon domain